MVSLHHQHGDDCGMVQMGLRQGILRLNLLRPRQRQHREQLRIDAQTLGPQAPEGRQHIHLRKTTRTG